MQANIQNYVMEAGPAFMDVAKAIMDGYDAQCPLVMPDQTSPMNQLKTLYSQVQQTLPTPALEQPAQAAPQRQAAAPEEAPAVEGENAAAPAEEEAAAPADSAANNANNNK